MKRYQAPGCEVLDATFQKMDAALPRGGGLKEEAEDQNGSL